MRLFRSTILGLSLLALTGCGTAFNLNDSPTGTMFIGTGQCYPFGGVVRSSFLAFAGPPVGSMGVLGGSISIIRGDVAEGAEELGHGMLFLTAGLGAIVDVPLSLAADIVTFPVAYARCNGYSWATWWGKESSPDLSTPLPLESIEENILIEPTDDELDQLPSEIIPEPTDAEPPPVSSAASEDTPPPQSLP